MRTMIEYHVYYRRDGITINSSHDTFASASGTASALAGNGQTIFLGANIGGYHSGLLYKYRTTERSLVNKGFLAQVMNAERDTK